MFPIEIYYWCNILVLVNVSWFHNGVRVFIKQKSKLLTFSISVLGITGYQIFGYILVNYSGVFFLNWSEQTTLTLDGNGNYFIECFSDTMILVFQLNQCEKMLSFTLCAADGISWRKLMYKMSSTHNFRWMLIIRNMCWVTCYYLCILHMI